MAYYWLTPPSKVIFIISLVLAILAIVVWLGLVGIPIVKANLFETMLLAWFVLLIGNLFRGL